MFDRIFKNGNILTVDNDMSTKSWLAVKDGKIAALGNGEAPGEAKEIVDLAGKTMMPGIIDSHVHCSMTGIGENGIDLSGIDSSQGILDAVEAYCSKEKKPRVI